MYLDALPPVRSAQNRTKTAIITDGSRDEDGPSISHCYFSVVTDAQPFAIEDQIAKDPRLRGSYRGFERIASNPFRLRQTSQQGANDSLSHVLLRMGSIF